MSGDNETERTDVLAGGDRAVDEPADRALGDSQEAANGCKAITKAYKATNEDPPFVDRARTVWNALLPVLPRRNLMGGVNIKWLNNHPYTEMQTFGLQAWTNSATEVYVNCPQSGIRADTTLETTFWRVVLYHEALHVVQFAESGRPPETYAKMMEYEKEAYDETYKWLENTSHPQQYKKMIDKHGFDKQMKEKRNYICRKIDNIERNTSHIQNKQKRHERQEEKYKAFLRHNGSLPEHENIEELYGL